MFFIYNFIIPGLWILLFAVWGLAALRLKQTSASESKASRAIHMTLILASFAFGLTPFLSFGPFAWRFIPQSPLQVALGVLVEALGIGFAIAARLYLGSNWSGTITLKVGQNLVRSGPYAITRHPIYTGMTLAMIGAALAYGEVRGLIAVALIVIAYLRKINLEEQYLRVQFGAQYDAYRQEVKALIPFIY